MTVDLVTKGELLELKQILHEILERLPKLLTGHKKEFLTAKEVKEILRCSDSTLSNYRNSNILSAKKVGGRFYYSQEDLNKLLNLQKGGSDGK
jgi:hypothetical protein